MQVNLFMRRQKSFDRLALMRREMVGNYMDLLAARLIGYEVSEEGDEFGRGVACRGLAQDLTGFGIEGGV